MVFMRNFIIAIFLLLPLFLFGQEISFDKDTLYLFIAENNPDASDSLWLKNSGHNELVIDSIISVNQYGYKLNFSNSDTSFFYGLPSEFENDISITPKDSIRIIFSNPDKCPLCKVNPLNGTLTDTVIFRTNSAINATDSIVIIIDEAANIDYKITFPSEIMLFQNYPNPFNPVTKIKFYIPKSEFTSVNIYNSLGQNSVRLIDKFLLAGYYEISFDGSQLPSGIYFYSLKCGSQVITKQMLLLK